MSGRRSVAIVLCACLLCPPPGLFAEDQGKYVPPKEVLEYLESQGVFHGAQDPARAYFGSDIYTTPLGAIMYRYLHSRHNPGEAVDEMKEQLKALSEAPLTKKKYELIAPKIKDIEDAFKDLPSAPAGAEDSFGLGVKLQAVLTGIAAVDAPKGKVHRLDSRLGGQDIYDEKEGVLYHYDADGVMTFNGKLQKEQIELNKRAPPGAPEIPADGTYNKEYFRARYWTLQTEYESFERQLRFNRLYNLIELLGVQMKEQNLHDPVHPKEVNEKLEKELIERAKLQVFTENNHRYSLWDIAERKARVWQAYLKDAAEALDYYDRLSKAYQPSSKPNQEVIKQLYEIHGYAGQGVQLAYVEGIRYSARGQLERLDPDSGDYEALKDALKASPLDVAAKEGYKVQGALLRKRTQRVLAIANRLEDMIRKTKYQANSDIVSPALNAAQNEANDVSSDATLFTSAPALLSGLQGQAARWLPSRHDSWRIWDGTWSWGWGRKVVATVNSLWGGAHASRMDELNRDYASYQTIAQLVSKGDYNGARQAVIALHPEAAYERTTSSLTQEPSKINEAVKVSASMERTRDTLTAVMTVNRITNVAADSLTWAVGLGAVTGKLRLVCKAMDVSFGKGADLLLKQAEVSWAHGPVGKPLAVLAWAGGWTSKLIAAAAEQSWVQLTSLEPGLPDYSSSILQSPWRRNLNISASRVYSAFVRQGYLVAMSGGISGGYTVLSHFKSSIPAKFRLLGRDWDLNAGWSVDFGDNMGILSGIHSIHPNNFFEFGRGPSNFSGVLDALGQGMLGGAEWASQSFHPLLNYIGIPSTLYEGTPIAAMSESVGSKGLVGNLGDFGRWIDDLLRGTSIRDVTTREEAKNAGELLKQKNVHQAYLKRQDLYENQWDAADSAGSWVGKSVSWSRWTGYRGWNMVKPVPQFVGSMASNLIKFSVFSAVTGGTANWGGQKQFSDEMGVPEDRDSEEREVMALERGLKKAKGWGNWVEWGPFWLILPTFPAKYMKEIQAAQRSLAGIVEYENRPGGMEELIKGGTEKDFRLTSAEALTPFWLRGSYYTFHEPVSEQTFRVSQQDMQGLIRKFVLKYAIGGEADLSRLAPETIGKVLNDTAARGWEFLQRPASDIKKAPASFGEFLKDSVAKLKEAPGRIGQSIKQTSVRGWEFLQRPASDIKKAPGGAWQFLKTSVVEVRSVPDRIAGSWSAKDIDLGKLSDGQIRRVFDIMLSNPDERPTIGAAEIPNSENVRIEARKIFAEALDKHSDLLEKVFVDPKFTLGRTIKGFGFLSPKQRGVIASMIEYELPKNARISPQVRQAIEKLETRKIRVVPERVINVLAVDFRDAFVASEDKGKDFDRHVQINQEHLKEIYQWTKLSKAEQKARPYTVLVAEFRAKVEKLHADGQLGANHHKSLMRQYEFFDGLREQFESFNKPEIVYKLLKEHVDYLHERCAEQYAGKPDAAGHEILDVLKTWSENLEKFKDNAEKSGIKTAADGLGSLLDTFYDTLQGESGKNLLPEQVEFLRHEIKHEMTGTPWLIHDAKGSAMEDWSPAQFLALFDAVNKMAIQGAGGGEIRAFQGLTMGGGKTLLVLVGLLPVIEADARALGKEVKFFTVQSNLAAQAELDWRAYQRTGKHELSFATYEELKSDIAHAKSRSRSYAKKIWIVGDEMDGMALQPALTEGETSGVVKLLDSVAVREDEIYKPMHDALSQGFEKSAQEVKLEARGMLAVLKDIMPEDEAIKAIKPVLQAADSLAAAHGSPLREYLAKRAVCEAVDELGRHRAFSGSRPKAFEAASQNIDGLLSGSSGRANLDAAEIETIREKVDKGLSWQDHLLALVSDPESLWRGRKALTAAAERAQAYLNGITSQLQGTHPGDKDKKEALTREAAQRKVEAAFYESFPGMDLELKRAMQLIENKHEAQGATAPGLDPKVVRERLAELRGKLSPEQVQALDAFEKRLAGFAAKKAGLGEWAANFELSGRLATPEYKRAEKLTESLYKNEDALRDFRQKLSPEQLQALEAFDQRLSQLYASKDPDIAVKISQLEPSRLASAESSLASVTQELKSMERRVKLGKPLSAKLLERRTALEVQRKSLLAEVEFCRRISTPEFFRAQKSLERFQASRQEFEDVSAGLSAEEKKVLEGFEADFNEISRLSGSEDPVDIAQIEALQQSLARARDLAEFPGDARAKTEYAQALNRFSQTVRDLEAANDALRRPVDELTQAKTSAERLAPSEKIQAFSKLKGLQSEVDALFETRDGLQAQADSLRRQLTLLQSRASKAAVGEDIRGFGAAFEKDSKQIRALLETGDASDRAMALHLQEARQEIMAAFTGGESPVYQVMERMKERAAPIALALSLSRDEAALAKKAADRTRKLVASGAQAVRDALEALTELAQAPNLSSQDVQLLKEGVALLHQEELFWDQQLKEKPGLWQDLLQGLPSNLWMVSVDFKGKTLTKFIEKLESKDLGLDKALVRRVKALLEGSQNALQGTRPDDFGSSSLRSEVQKLLEGEAKRHGAVEHMKSVLDGAGKNQGERQEFLKRFRLQADISDRAAIDRVEAVFEHVERGEDALRRRPGSNDSKIGVELALTDVQMTSDKLVALNERRLDGEAWLPHLAASYDGMPFWRRGVGDIECGLGLRLLGQVFRHPVEYAAKPAARLMGLDVSIRPLAISEDRLGLVRLYSWEMLRAVLADPLMPAGQRDMLTVMTTLSLLFPRTSFQAQGSGSSWVRQEFLNLVQGYFDEYAGVRMDNISGKTNVIHNGQWFETMDNPTRRFWELHWKTDITLPYSHKNLSTMRDLYEKGVRMFGVSGTNPEKLAEEFRGHNIVTNEPEAAGAGQDHTLMATFTGGSGSLAYLNEPKPLTEVTLEASEALEHPDLAPGSVLGERLRPKLERFFEGKEGPQTIRFDEVQDADLRSHFRKIGRVQQEAATPKQRSLGQILTEQFRLVARQSLEGVALRPEEVLADIPPELRRTAERFFRGWGLEAQSVRPDMMTGAEGRDYLAKRFVRINPAEAVEGASPNMKVFLQAMGLDGQTEATVDLNGVEPGSLREELRRFSRPGMFDVAPDALLKDPDLPTEVRQFFTGRGKDPQVIHYQDVQDPGLRAYLQRLGKLQSGLLRISPAEVEGSASPRLKVFLQAHGLSGKREAVVDISQVAPGPLREELLALGEPTKSTGLLTVGLPDTRMLRSIRQFFIRSGLVSEKETAMVFSDAEWLRLNRVQADVKKQMNLSGLDNNEVRILFLDTRVGGRGLDMNFKGQRSLKSLDAFKGHSYHRMVIVYPEDASTVHEKQLRGRLAKVTRTLDGATPEFLRVIDISKVQKDPVFEAMFRENKNIADLREANEHGLRDFASKAARRLGHRVDVDLALIDEYIKSEMLRLPGSERVQTMAGQYEAAIEEALAYKQDMNEKNGLRSASVLMDQPILGTVREQRVQQLQYGR